MAIDPATILAMVRDTLIDPDGVFWTTEDLERYYNAAVRSICNAKPDAYTRIRDWPLVNGALQTIPEDGVQLFDVPRNVNGPVIRQVTKEALDNARPNWMQANATGTLKHFVTDVRYPRRFYVYPPSLGAQAEVVYGAIPEEIGGESSGWSRTRVSDMIIGENSQVATYT